jgi:hypothetical protein
VEHGRGDGELMVDGQLVAERAHLGAGEQVGDLVEQCLRPAALHGGEPVTVLRAQRRMHRSGVGRDGDPALIPRGSRVRGQQEALVHQGPFDVRP